MGVCIKIGFRGDKIQSVLSEGEVFTNTHELAAKNECTVYTSNCFETNFENDSEIVQKGKHRYKPRPLQLRARLLSNAVSDLPENYTTFLVWSNLDYIIIRDNWDYHCDYLYVSDEFIK